MFASEAGSGELNELLARFESHARSQGKKTAVVDGRQRLDFQTLDQISGAIAARLLANRGEAVIVLVQDEIAMVAGLLGAQKAGKTFVPLNPTFPEARLSSIVSQLQSGTILVDQTTAEKGRRLAAADFQLAVIEDLQGVDLAADFKAPYLPQALAWIIFTSGSTGKPKGVMQSYRNANRFVAQAIRSLDLRSRDRLATASSLTSHAGNIFTLATLATGATLCLMEPAKRAPAELARWLSLERVTILGTVPTLLRRLAEAYPRVNAFQTLRQLRLSGETVTPGDFALYNRVCPPDCSLAVGYGMTETGGISQDFFTHESTLADGRVPVGFNHDEVEIQIVDEQGEIVPVGQAGEIKVISRCLSPGYWQRPDLTQQAFSDLPDGRRSFLTGDLGQVREDGTLLHLGRKDSQVQIAGQRVDAAEIEVALRSLPGIREAAVQPFVEPDGRVRLIAYVTLERALEALQIRKQLAAKLPAHMLPSKTIVLDTFPLSGNGKLDRHALPGPGSAEFERRTPRTALRTESEKQMAAIWREILNVQRVGLDDSFFELGGDSLLGLNLLARIEQEYGCEAPRSALLHAPTIRLLLEHLQNPTLNSEPTILVPFQTAGDRPPFFVMHGIWGDLLAYRNVAPHLESHQPFYGLERVNAPEGAIGHETMQDLAARCAALIRAKQPAGPYFLGGFCFGGVLAYEVACQLDAQGQQTALLVIIDGAAPADLRSQLPLYDELRIKVAREALPSWRRRYAAKAKARLRKRFRAGAQAESDSSRNSGRARVGIETNIRAAGLKGRPPSQEKIRENHRRLLQSYRPQQYAGRVSLIRAREIPARRLLRAGYDPLGGWSNLALGGVDLRFVDGTHRTLLNETNAPGLARELTKLLREATATCQGERTKKKQR